MKYNVTDIEFDLDDDYDMTEEEAMNRYRSGDYKDSSYDIDDMFYDYEFCSINEENDTFIDINNTGGKY